MHGVRGAAALLGFLATAFAATAVAATAWPLNAVSMNTVSLNTVSLNTVSASAAASPDPVPGDLNGDGVARVVAVGDSIMEGAAPRLTDEFRAAGYEAAVDTAVSRSTVAGADVVRFYTAMGADAMVIMLGANDAGNPDTFRTRVRGVLDAAEDVPLVMWLTIPEVRDYYPVANEVLREEMAAREGGSVLEWSTVAAGDGVTAGDGLHLTRQGTGTMAGFVVASVAEAIDTASSTGEATVEPLERSGGHPDSGAESSGGAENSEGADSSAASGRSAASGPRDDSPSQGEPGIAGRVADSIDSLVGPGRLLTAVVLVAGALACGGIGVGLWSMARTRGRPAST